MSQLFTSATPLLLLQFCATLVAATVYNSYTSDITKAYLPATAAGTTTAAIFPKTLKSYASSAALSHTHSPDASHTPCKKHLHPAQSPHFYVRAAPAHYYRHFYHAAAPVSLPVPALPTVYLISAPPAAALSDYAAAPPPEYAAAFATRPSAYAATAGAASAASYYDHFHANRAAAAAAVVRPHLPYAAYAPASAASSFSSADYGFSGDFAWQQALQGNFAK